MQTTTRAHPAFVAALVALAAASCVKEISSEERLDRELQLPPVGETIDAKQLAATHCQDVAPALAKARSESRPEGDRLDSYAELYESLKTRTDRFEIALTRNPDLAYQEDHQEIVAAREICIQQTADVRMEFDRYVRELVDVPTVQEIKGGNTVTVARLDFGVLRDAIETLAPDDAEQMLARVAAAEKRVGTTSSGGRKRRR